MFDSLLKSANLGKRLTTHCEFFAAIDTLRYIGYRNKHRSGTLKERSLNLEINSMLNKTPGIQSVLVSLTVSTLLSLVNIQSAQAVNIAVVDSGINHAVLGGVLEAGGYDFVNDDSDASDDSANQHGTSAGHVAINSGSSITLTSIKSFDPSFNTSTQILDNSFNYIATLDGVQVIAHTGASISSTSVSALQNAANSGSGKIIVFQAGNFAGANPAGDAQQVAALDGLGIVAGGQDYSATNLAGNMKDFYIVAPTRALISDLNGTSMATPRIAAAAGTVLGNHPFLSPRQVVQILFQSADDLGEPGVDAVYGHGALNLTNALNQVGAGTIPTDTGGSGGGGGGGGGAGAAALILGGGWAYTYFKKDKVLKKTLIIDSFGRAFNFDLSRNVSVRDDSKPSIFALMSDQKSDITRVPLKNRGVKNGNDGQPIDSITFAFVNKQEVTPNLRAAFDSKFDSNISFLHNAQGVNSSYSMALNADLSTNFGALSFAGDKQQQPKIRFFSNDLFTTPVMGYSSQGSSFQYGWGKDDVNRRLGVSVIDDQAEHGHQSNSVLYETSLEKENYRMGFQVGALVEQGSLLGGSSDSVLGVENTSTYYLGLNGAYNVTDDISLLGGFFQGVSTVEESKNSLLTDFSTIRTEGYAVGMLMDNLFTSKGSMGLSYSSPLQTTGGSATLTLPVSQDTRTGTIGFESTGLSFENGDQEKIFEAYYNYEVNRNNNIFTHFSYTKNPTSEPEANLEKAVFFGWKRNF